MLEPWLGHGSRFRHGSALPQDRPASDYACGPAISNCACSSQFAETIVKGLPASTRDRFQLLLRRESSIGRSWPAATSAVGRPVLVALCNLHEYLNETGNRLSLGLILARSVAPDSWHQLTTMRSGFTQLVLQRNGR